MGLLFSLSLMGQEFISGVVYDGHTLRPMADATVRIGHRNMRTDATGTFTLPVKKKSRELEVSATGFHDYDRKFTDMVDYNQVEIYLGPKPTIKNVKTSSGAIGVYEPDFEYLFDFEFVDNLLFIGSYLNRNISDRSRDLSLENCALTLFIRGEQAQRIIIPDFPQRLRRSAFGELFIEGMNYAVRIIEDAGTISYSEFDFKEYANNVVPWTVALSKSAFKVRIVKEIPQVVHYCYRTDLQSQKVIRTARNRAYFTKTFLDYTMLDPDQKAFANSLGEKQGFDRELYAGYIRTNNREPDYRLPQPHGNQIYRDLRPPYTPVYKQGNEVLIFDAMNQWIYLHNEWGEAIDSVYFQIDLRGEDLLQIEQDRVSEKIYVIHQKKGVYLLREIIPSKGALSKPLKIAFAYPEKLKIYNGDLFYIRHDADKGFKHLYKEMIDFN